MDNNNCLHCGKDLPEGRRVFCSEECVEADSKDHANLPSMTDQDFQKAMGNILGCT